MHAEAFLGLYVLTFDSLSDVSILCNQILNVPIDDSVIITNKQSDKASFELFHKRLGHISLSSLLQIPYCNKTNFICDACLLTKFHKLSFLISTTCASFPFKLLRMHIWGPFNTPSISSDNFFLIIVDDKSRCTWTYLMKNKSQTIRFVTNFLFFLFKTNSMVLLNS